MALSCSPAPPPADLVFHNGAVYTLDPERSWAEGIAVRDGRIVALSDVAVFIGDGTSVIDLDGRLILPGFHDGSVDLESGAAWLAERNIDLTPIEYIHRFGITSISRDGPARFESQWPWKTVDPLVAIHTAVTGEDLDGRLVSSDRMPVEDAIAAYTSSSLAIGNAADLAVVSANLLKIPPDRIAESKVEMTVVAGEIVYAAATFDQVNERQ